MSSVYAVEETFERVDVSQDPLPQGDYEGCRFSHCHFSRADLSKLNLMECTVDHCDLSMAKVSRAAFKDVTFNHCKLLGVHFEDSEKFLLQLGFNDCILHLATFNGLPLKGTHFNNCHLQEADFTGADLRDSVFNNCDLHRTIFDHTQLERADFRGSYNYSIDPEANRLKKARFSLEGSRGLLNKYDIIIE